MRRNVSGERGCYTGLQATTYAQGLLHQHHCGYGLHDVLLVAPHFTRPWEHTHTVRISSAGQPRAYVDLCLEGGKLYTEAEWRTGRPRWALGDRGAEPLFTLPPGTVWVTLERR